MRLRPFLHSAALLTTLLATSAPINNALAQKSAVLSPLTPWALTKVSASGEQAAYCAMARRFGQNTILTFARNGMSEASMALDFQAPRLRTGENMKIVLDPGAGEQRSYYISPISAQAFVVRLGRDDKFFKALSTTGFMRIEAAGRTYSFDLADIDAGQRQLAGCLDAAGTLGPASAVDEASADGGDIHSEIARLRSDIQSLREENKKLSTDEVSEPSPRRESMSEERTASSGMSTGQIERDAGALPVNHLTDQSHRLQKELNALTLGGPAAVEVHEKIASLEQQNQALKTDLKKGPDNDDWRDTQAELFTLKEENKRLQKLLEEKSGSFALVENLQEQVDSLKSENSELGEKLGSAKEDAVQAIKEAPVPGAPDPSVLVGPAIQNDPQTKIEELMAQLRDKDAKLVEMGNLSLELEALKSKNAALTKKSGKLASENERLRKENAALKEQLAQYTKANEAQQSEPMPQAAMQQSLQEELTPLPGGATDAQRQEAEMRQGMNGQPLEMKQEAQTNGIRWNSPPSVPQKSPQQKSDEPQQVALSSPEFSIKKALVRAQIASSDQLQKVEKASKDGRSAYQWRVEDIYGSAEQRPMPDISAFDGEMQKYLDKTKNRCTGDFAASPGDDLEKGSEERMMAYEVACVGKGIDSSASLLFVGKGGTFTVAAHETTSGNMDEAMTLRERLMQAIMGL